MVMPSPTTAAPSTDVRAPAYAIMCCCPSGSSIPGAPDRASGEALVVGAAAARGRPANGLTPAAAVNYYCNSTNRGRRIWDIIV